MSEVRKFSIEVDESTTVEELMELVHNRTTNKIRTFTLVLDESMSDEDIINYFMSVKDIVTKK